MRGSQHPSLSRAMPGGMAARSSPGMVGQLCRVPALTAPTDPRLHPKTIEGG